MKKDVDEIKKAIKRAPASPIPSKDFLSTGSTLLNLACSGKRSGGFHKGGYILIVGDSASGKTFLSLTCLAEAARNKHFKDHRFIFDDVEGGALMDVVRFFGSMAAERMEPPARDDDGNAVYSGTIEEFFYHIDDAQKQGDPFIYILDSMDALDSDEDAAKFQDRKTAHRKGKQTSGSYGTSKPKFTSANIRRVINKLKRTGSILIIISQTRDNIGFGSQFEPKTRAGGRALRFYAHMELWSSIAKKLKRNVNGVPRQIGIICKAQVKKNRLVGRLPSIELPIYWSSGFADTDACIHFLIKEKHWKGTDSKVAAPEFEYNGSIEGLVKQIEKNDDESVLQSITASVWQQIEESSCVERKQRYK